MLFFIICCSWDDSESLGINLNIDNEDYFRYLLREYRVLGSRRGMVYGYIDFYGVDDSEEEGVGFVE